jgi:hypothetical protein
MRLITCLFFLFLTQLSYGLALRTPLDLLSINCTAAPQSKFVILATTNAVAGADATVTIQLQTLAGALDTSGNQRIKLVTSTMRATTTPSDGIVTLASGSATISVTDMTAETVTLSLDDVDATGFDVSSTRTQTFVAGMVFSL